MRVPNTLQARKRLKDCIKRPPQHRIPAYDAQIAQELDTLEHAFGPEVEALLLQQAKAVVEREPRGNVKRCKVEPLRHVHTTLRRPVNPLLQLCDEQVIVVLHERFVFAQGGAGEGVRDLLADAVVVGVCRVDYGLYVCGCVDEEVTVFLQLALVRFCAVDVCVRFFISILIKNNLI